MISKFAVEKFIDQPRRDLREWKQLTDSELEDEVDKLPTQPPIWDKLSFPQKVCFLLGSRLKRLAAFLDTGEGKTLLAIALIRYFYRSGQGKRALVLVPYKVNKNEWKDEILKHSPTTSHIVLTESSVDKWATLEEDPPLIVIETYAGLVRMACESVPTKSKKKNKLVPSAKLVQKLVGIFDMLILDESTAVQSHQSLAFRICRQIRKRATLVLALTGTPFGRDPMALWAQMYLIDLGESLGATLGLFRATFFNEWINYWGAPEYTFLKKKMGLLNRMLAHSAIRFEADKTKMPVAVSVIKYVTLPEDAQTYYDKAREAIIAARGNYKEMQNAFLRMRQISSGFLGYYDDEMGTKAKFVFPENPKLEMLLSVIESLSHKAVIFADFVWSGQTISRELKKMKIRHLYLPDVKDSESVSKMFADDPDSHLVISTAGAYGLNLQPARYLLFFESPVGVIARKQVTRRVERQYSLHEKVYLYDFVTRNTMDEKILQFHKEGGDLFKAIIDGKVKL